MSRGIFTYNHLHQMDDMRVGVDLGDFPQLGVAEKFMHNSTKLKFGTVVASNPLQVGVTYCVVSNKRGWKINIVINDLRNLKIFVNDIMFSFFPIRNRQAYEKHRQKIGQKSLNEKFEAFFHNNNS